MRRVLCSACSGAAGVFTIIRAEVEVLEHGIIRHSLWSRPRAGAKTNSRVIPNTISYQWGSHIILPIGVIEIVWVNFNKPEELRNLAVRTIGDITTVTCSLSKFQKLTQGIQ
jgi:hypothetical protein